MFLPRIIPIAADGEGEADGELEMDDDGETDDDGDEEMELLGELDIEIEGEL